MCFKKDFNLTSIILLQTVKAIGLDFYMSIIEFFKYIIAQKILKRKIIPIGSDY